MTLAGNLASRRAWRRRSSAASLCTDDLAIYLTSGEVDGSLHDSLQNTSLMLGDNWQHFQSRIAAGWRRDRVDAEAIFTGIMCHRRNGAIHVLSDQKSVKSAPLIASRQYSKLKTPQKLIYIMQIRRAIPELFQSPCSALCKLQSSPRETPTKLAASSGSLLPSIIRKLTLSQNFSVLRASFH